VLAKVSSECPAIRQVIMRAEVEADDGLRESMTMTVRTGPEPQEPALSALPCPSVTVKVTWYWPMASTSTFSARTVAVAPSVEMSQEVLEESKPQLSLHVGARSEGS